MEHTVYCHVLVSTLTIPSFLYSEALGHIEELGKFLLRIYIEQVPVIKACSSSGPSSASISSGIRKS